MKECDSFCLAVNYSFTQLACIFIIYLCPYFVGEYIFIPFVWLQCKADIYRGSSMFHCATPVSCMCTVCMTSLMVLWRLCCVFGAVSGLLRAERVANE